MKSNELKMYDEFEIRKFEKWRDREDLIDAAKGGRLRSKADAWVARQIELAASEGTLTSGFGKEVLRLTGPDLKFLADCGIAAE